MKSVSVSIVATYLALTQFALAGTLPAIDLDEAALVFDNPVFAGPFLIPRPGKRSVFVANDVESLSSAIDDELDLEYASAVEVFADIFNEMSIISGFKSASINQPYTLDSLNLYLLEGRFLNDNKIDISICKYFSPHSMIVCNATNLRKFTSDFIGNSDYHKVAVIQKTHDGKLVRDTRIELDPHTRHGIDANLSLGFLSWIVAHEIGHAVLHSGDSKRSFYFNATANSKIEDEADAYASILISKTQLSFHMAALSLDEFVESRFADIVENEPHKIIDEQAGNYFSTRFRIAVDLSKAQDRLLYRAINIYSELVDLIEDLDETGTYKMVSSNIELRNEKWRLFVPDFLERLIE